MREKAALPRVICLEPGTRLLICDPDRPRHLFLVQRRMAFATVAEIMQLSLEPTDHLGHMSFDI